MDAEKWKKITASFQSRYPEISQIQEGNSALPKQCTDTQCDTNETTNPFEHHPSLENDEVQHLKFLLTEKCQLIEKQGRTISRLEWKLDSLLAKGDGESHETDETVGEKPSNVRSKENAPKSDLPANPPKSSAHKVDSKNLLPIILDRLESLEKQMDLLMKKLPHKLRLHCDEYLSKCKFQYDEDGEFFIVQKINNKTSLSQPQPAWERSPKIRPRTNTAFELRNMRKQGDPVIKEKSDGKVESSSDSTNNNNNNARMVRLEEAVNELKISFIQLLLDGLKTDNKANGNQRKDDKNVHAMSAQLKKLICS